MPPAGSFPRDGEARGHRVDAGAKPDAHWARVKAVFLEALEHPESERSAFVWRASSGDPELRTKVESLLASDGAAGSFCETPAAAILGEIPPTHAGSASHLLPGTRLGAYEILEFIAAGGMGEVYRARHTVLGREVAIKTVGPSLSDEAARRRLIREARHASLLSHPNICAIHDVGVADGLPFIVMGYVDGQPLNEILRHEVPPLRDALGLAVQIADALAHAHAQGIIHRDLKSSNIVVDRAGNPIVLDFGLARRLPDSATTQSHGSTLTAGDDLAGTLSHMAPEVLRGERADARSDVWSLGVLLYELVTGELPFRGRTSFETSSAILGEPAQPIGLRVPLALRLVIDRCLTKDPLGRYQRADDVRDALDAIRRHRSWTVGGRLLLAAHRRGIYAGAAVTCLVVALAIGGRALRARFGASVGGSVSTLALLPLRNATGDPRSTYYADGLTEALTTQLGASGDVRVVSRASTARVAAKGPAEAGATLGADVVVDGSLRQAGNRIRVVVSLLVPSNGRTIWSRTFERDASEVLALEADVVSAVAGAVRVTLRPGARERLTAVRAVSPAVYEEYLKGRYEWNKRTPASLQSAMVHFTRAIALDSTYAPAHAALADCLNQLGTVMLGSGSPRELRPRAAAQAIQALQLDAGSAEAHAALGYAWHYDWRFAEAEREFRRAIELNPSYSMAHIWYANLLMSRMRMKEALEQVFMARDLDPFSLIVNTNVGWVLDRAGRHEDAIVQFEKTLALDSTYTQARWRLADALMNAGHVTEAITQGERLVSLSDSAPPALAMLAETEARGGQRDLALRLLARARTRAGANYLPPASVAGVFARLGEVDSALTWLEKTVAERSNASVYLGGERKDSPLRHDPRFRALLVRVGLE
jgi:TolB-like protein/tetratricopeptide (TPR) repeat protein/tRNA A-37 threonylcarbamoyl transferase component Bud32